MASFDILDVSIVSKLEGFVLGLTVDGTGGGATAGLVLGVEMSGAPRWRIEALISPILFGRRIAAPPIDTSEDLLLRPILIGDRVSSLLTVAI